MHDLDEEIQTKGMYSQEEEEYSIYCDTVWGPHKIENVVEYLVKAPNIIDRIKHLRMDQTIRVSTTFWALFSASEAYKPDDTDH
jgi:hypothetical protein